MKTLDTTVTTGGLNEVYQSVGIKFAMANKTGKNSYKLNHQFVKCRDYFTDLLVAARTKKDFKSIYGIKAKGKTDPIELNSLILVIKGDALLRLATFKRSIRLLQDFEEACGIKPTKVDEVEGNSYLILTASRRWLVSSAVLSLYTHLLRALYGHCNNPESETTLRAFLDRIKIGNSAEGTVQRRIDGSFDLNILMTNAVSICKGSKRPLEAYGEMDVYNLHNTGGILTASAVAQGRYNTGSGTDMQAQRSHKLMVDRYNIIKEELAQGLAQEVA